MGGVHQCCVLYLSYDLYVNHRIEAEDRGTLGMLSEVPGSTGYRAGPDRGIGN
jgi:hypothetical protein